MFKVAIGHSEDPYVEDATNEVILDCQVQLGNLTPQVCMVFAAIDYDFTLLLKKLHEAFPETQIIGCSSSGEMSINVGYAEGSLLLVAFSSNTIQMVTAVARNISQDITVSVDNALAEARSKLKEEPSLCFTFPDIFTIGTVRLVEELKNRLGKNFPIFGGGASDPWKFDQTKEFYNEEILTDAAPLLFFAGPIEIIYKLGSGWEPFTTQKPIVEANKNTIFKIGDHSALEFYKHYLGGSPTLAHPLAVFEEGQKRFYLRVALKTNEEDGSILFGGDLPEHSTTSICRADPKDLINETKNLVKESKKEFNETQPDCAFVISCSCRQKILGTKTKDEYKVIHEELSPDLPVFGFYAYGQVSPFDKNAPSFVHNETIVTLFMKEKR